MLYDLYIDSFRDGCLGWFIGLLMWTISIVLAILILWGCLYLIDSVGIEEQQAHGKIVKMYYSPETTTVIYHQVGKIMVPQTIHVPESWNVCIMIGDLTDDVQVSHYDFNRIQMNQTVQATYGNGRIWDSMYVTDFKY